MPAVAKSAMRTRRQDQARQRYQDAKARRACVEAVWARDGHDGWAPCFYCRVPVERNGGWWWRGHIHERLARSLGGDAHDSSGAVVTCRACHFPGPSGAHRRSVRVER